MRASKPFLFLLSLVLVGAFAGCGDDENLQQRDVPSLSLSAETPQNIHLNLPCTSTTRTWPQTRIKIQNSGQAPMEVSKLEWVAKPDRLVATRGTTDDTCSYDDDAPNLDSSGTCTGETLCSFTTNRCQEKGLPQTPFTIDTNRVQEISTMILPGDTGALDCPEPPSDRDVPDDYCGEILLETNANNSSEVPAINDGNLRIFFLQAPRSGQIAVSPTTINFTGVSAGESMGRDLTITNPDPSENLTITNMNIEGDRALFSYDGPPAPTDIPAGGSKDWRVEFNAPTDWDGEALGATLEVASTATNECNQPVSLTAASQRNLPAIQLDPGVLRFDANAQQTLTVSNEGSANLRLTNVGLDPSSASDAYSFSIDSESFTTSVPSNKSVIQPGQSVDITIDFTSDGNPASGIATLQLDYNYFIDDDTRWDSASATLLGEVGDAPVGMVSPDSFAFNVDGSGSQTRSLALRNVGTQPLDITDVDLTVNLGAEADFDLAGAVQTVAPGSLQEVQVTYEPTTSDDSNVAATLTSNTAGRPLSVLLTGSPNTSGDHVDAVITAGFADDTTEVGAEASFSARQSTVDDASSVDMASWVLLERPDSSKLFVDKQGGDITFVPDVAGTYKISVVVHDGGATSQASYTFEAQ